MKEEDDVEKMSDGRTSQNRYSRLHRDKSDMEKMFYRYDNESMLRSYKEALRPTQKYLNMPMKRYQISNQRM